MNTIKLISKPIYYIVYCFFLLSIIGCNEEINKVIPEEEPFNLETYNWKNVPDNIQNQVIGQGCQYTPINNDNINYMSNGLIKINGIYEVLEDKLINSSD